MKKYAFIEIILAGVLWGTSAIFVHYLAPYGVTSLQMTFVRSFVSFIILFAYGLLKDRKMFCIAPKELLLFLGSGISFFGTAACYFISMQATSVSTAVILMYTAPVYVMVYSVLFLRERFTYLKLAALIIMLSGCVFVSGVIGGLKFDIIGILFGVISGICFSAYNIMVKIEMSQKSNPYAATCYCFLFASIIGLIVCEPLQIPMFIVKDVAVLPLMQMLGICTCILPYSLHTLALRVLPAGTASTLAIVEPMSATLFSIILFSEPMSIFSVCGIVLILGAVVLLSKSKE